MNLISNRRKTFLKVARNSKKISIGRLSRKTGLSSGFLKKIENGLFKENQKLVKKYLSGLNMLYRGN